MDIKWLLQIALTVYCHSILVQSLESSKVVASLYGTVILPCSFPFIRGLEGLSVVWEKEGLDGRRRIVYRLLNGQQSVEDQDSNYILRTELSKECSQGKVDLTLRNVTFDDEGTYYCRAANKKGQGENEVELHIDDLHAHESVVTAVHIDEKRRLKCVGIGVFRDPSVWWYDEHGNDLSEHGTHDINDHHDGMKMLQSVLDVDVETNKHYFCQIKEGRLKRTARAVISDGEPVTFPETKLPE